MAKPNPYAPPDIIEEIATQWRDKGYGPFEKLKDDTYLLYHYKNPKSNAYHIHIGNSVERDDYRQGFASVKEGFKNGKPQYGNTYTGLNSGTFDASQWADHLWTHNGYNRYGGKHRTKKQRKRKSKKSKKM